MNPLVRLLVLLTVLLSLHPANRAQADWINMTGAETAPNIAEIYVEDDRLRLLLEVSIEDLEVFGDLIPNDLLAQVEAGRPTLAERLQRFSSQTFRVATEDGTPLQAELKLAEPRLRKDRYSPFAGAINPMTGRRVPSPPEDKRVLYAEIEYPFAERPETLTITPPVDEDGMGRLSLGFVTYHNSVPVIDFRHLSAAVTLRLNWNDPWYSRFDNPKLTRHHKSGLMSFLYVQPHEVRHEVLARVKDLEAWMDLGLRNDLYIEPDEWDALKARVGEFLASRNRVLIDGKSIDPIVDRTNFITTSLQGIQTLDEPRRLATPTAIVGVILVYVIDGIAGEVSVDWDLFSEKIQRVPAIATDPAGPFPSFVEPQDPVLRWQNFLNDYRVPTIEPVPLGPDRTLAVPLLTVVSIVLALVAGGLALKPRVFPRKAWMAVAVLGLAGAAALPSVGVVEVENPLAGVPDEAAATEIVAALVGNLHDTLQLREESKLQSALALNVSQPRLAEVLPELRRAFAIKIQGGGTARVDRIEDVAVQNIAKLPDGAGFRALAAWSADASASHWGHLHQRRMRFSALMELVPVDNTWKLLGVTVVDVQQES
jgi:hypothetical protein